MATTIVTKYGSDAPEASDIVRGELAVDTENGRLYTENSSAAVVELGSNPSGNITFGDNGKAIFGAGSDLQIYHDGSSSRIVDAGTGSLKIQAENFAVNNVGDTENMITAVPDGAVSLFHNNAAKLATTATGIDITGTVTADGITNNGDVVFSKGATGVPIIKMSGFATANNPYGIINFYNEDGSQQGPNNAVQIKAIAKNSDGSGGELAFHTSTGTSSEGADAVERLRIDSSGSVGIGTSSPTGSGLHVHNSTGGEQYISSSNSAMRFVSTGGINYIQSGTATSSSSAAPLVFTNVGGSGETMRIDSSGDLIVGGTSSGANDAVSISNTGYIQAIVNGDTVGYFNRRTSDGEILRFQKDGTTVGIIGTEGGDLNIGNGDAGLQFINGTQSVRPFNVTTNARIDAQVDLGMASTRFKDAYLSGGIFLGGAVAANKLDDYEEGHHEPTVAMSTSGTITLSTSYDRFSYTKIGRLVTITGNPRISSVSSPVGTVSFTLPFAAASGATDEKRSGGVIRYYDNSAGSGSYNKALAWQIVENTSTLVIDNVNTDGSNLTPAASDEFYFSLSYITA